MKTQQLQRRILTAILGALIVAFTAIPFTGYITYGPVEITTLHIIVILGAAALGWKTGAVLGGVWGVACMVRALFNPLWFPFVNPLISLVPRVLVGVLAGLLFAGLRRTKLPQPISLVLTAVAGTLTNTVLVLVSLNIFGGLIQSYQQFYEMFKSILLTIIGLNGGIELLAAAVVVPVVYKAIQRFIPNAVKNPKEP